MFEHSLEFGRSLACSSTKQASKIKRRTKAVPVMGAAGLFSLAGGVGVAAAATGGPAADLPLQKVTPSHEIILGEEELSDVRPGDVLCRRQGKRGCREIGHQDRPRLRRLRRLRRPRLWLPWLRRPLRRRMRWWLPMRRVVGLCLAAVAVAVAGASRPEDARLLRRARKALIKVWRLGPGHIACARPGWFTVPVTVGGAGARLPDRWSGKSAT